MPKTKSCQKVCKICGCTDLDCSKCLAASGERCFWITPDLCSRCLNEALQPRFKILFFIEVAKSKLYGVDMKRGAIFPFLPRVGDQIAVAPGDDDREVESVYYFPGDPNPYQIFFKFDKNETVKRLTALGWKET